MTNHTTLHERSNKLITREIYYCQSSLIEDLFKQEQHLNGFSIDNIENFYDDSIEAIEQFLIYETKLDSDSWSELPFDERETLAEKQGFEPEPHEIYEWWLISDYLAEKLREYGDPILNNDYGTWWGRTTTGQAISMDYIIQKIVLETGYAQYG